MYVAFSIYCIDSYIHIVISEQIFFFPPIMCRLSCPVLHRIPDLAPVPDIGTTHTYENEDRDLPVDDISRSSQCVSRKMVGGYG